jgi:transformer-2 protein
MLFEVPHDLPFQAFERIGRVTSVRVMTDRETGRPKGFAFVNFEDESSVQRAVAEMNGVDIAGRPVRLDCSSSSRSGKGQGSRSGSDAPYNDRPNYGSSYNRDAAPTPAYGQPSRGYDYPKQAPSYPTSSYGRGSTQQSGSYDRNPPSYPPAGGDRYGSSSYGAPRDQPPSRGYDRQSDRAPARSYDRPGPPTREYDRPAPPARGYDRQPDNRRTDNSSHKQNWREEAPKRDRSRSRGRSLSLNSEDLDRRQKERHARKEKFAQALHAGWDREPNQNERAQQEAERRAVREAEATGRDITTIRADLLKQSNWQNY